VPVREIRREKAIYEGSPAGRENEGRILKPLRLKAPILKSGTTMLTKNKAITLLRNRKRPKVMRFKGKRSKFIIGFAKREAIAKAIAVIIMPTMPFLNSRPVVIRETKNKINTQMIRVLNILLNTLNYISFNLFVVQTPCKTVSFIPYSL